jgi:S1-C subfamily serine protease
MQSDMDMNPVSSGGPLIDAGSGNVIGVVSTRVFLPGKEGLSFAVSIIDALRSVGIVYR